MPNSHISRTATEAQQESSWSPPLGTLGELVHAAWDRAASIQPLRKSLEREAAGRASPGFADALRGLAVAVIAEVKRSSPSMGDLNRDIAAAARAGAYATGGAAAISVLTEPSRFGGSLQDLRDVVDSVSVPVLRKDFIVDEVQILEARAVGAAAILLIARAMEPRRLADLARFALAHEIEPLIEVRNRDELDRALDAGANVVGVNARNLETLEIEGRVPHDLIPLIPGGVIAVAESGVRDRSSVQDLARAGADAVLVGGALSVARDPESAVRDLTGVARVARNG